MSAAAARNHISPYRILRGPHASRRWIASDDVTPRLMDVCQLIGASLFPQNKWRIKAATLGTAGAIIAAKWIDAQAPNRMGRLTEKLTDKNVLRNGDSEDARDIVKLVVQYGGMKLLAQLLRELWHGMFAHVSQNAVTSMNRRVFEHLQQVDVDHIVTSRPGDVTQLVLNSGASLGAMMNNVVLRLVPMTLNIVQLQSRLRKSRNSPVAPIINSTLLAYIVFTMIYSEKRIKWRHADSKASARLRGVVQDSVLNAEISRLFNANGIQLTRFNKALMRGKEAALKVKTSLSKLNAGQKTVASVGTTMALLNTADRIFQGSSDIKSLISVQHDISSLINPMAFLGTMYREFKVNYEDLYRTLKTLKSLRTSVVERPGAKDLVINRGSIKLENLKFKYPSSQDWTIKNINMRIMGQSHVAIVGPSGAGKTTLIKLIARLYDPHEGSIKICGQDIRDVKLKSLRDILAIVPQEDILINDTLLENIRFGCPTATLEEVKTAVREAQLESVIDRLPEGLNTNVGERGLKLSGGERQRVCIARCLLRQPRIVVLDEATSKLDAHAEFEVRRAFDELVRTRTCITVAHKLSTVEKCDQIFFMDHGSIIEAGNHTELLQLNGQYAKMWAKQQLLQHDDDEGLLAWPVVKAPTTVAAPVPMASCSGSGSCSH